MAVETRKPIAHIIGRIANIFSRLFITQKTIDQSVPDYAFWDKFRHSLISGYEVAGSVSHTIDEIITAWVFGSNVDAKLVPVADKRMEAKVKYTNDILSRFMAIMQSFFLRAHEDYMGLGDIFIGVNPDGSLVSIPPNTVRLITDPIDPLEVVGMEVITVSDTATVIETWTETERVRQVALYNGQAPNPMSALVASANSLGAVNINPTALTNATVERYPNLIGEIPIVHFAQGKGMQELRGHPFMADVRSVLSEFDDLMNKSMQGAKVSGNPLPVFENLENPKETIDLNATQETDVYEDKDGNQTDRKVIKWDDLGALFLGKGGKFTFAAPPVGFSTDTISMLKFFRELIRDVAHTPGYVFGGDTTVNPNMTEQTPAWVKFIDGRRDKFSGQAFDDKLGIEAEGGLYELLHIFLLTKALTDPRILVAPTTIMWQEITEDDEKVTFEWAKFLNSRGALTSKTMLRLSGLVEGSEIESEYADAQAELEKNAALLPPTTDFGGTGNPVKNPPTTGDNTPDLRAGGGATAPRTGADAPRQPAYGGGGKTK